MNIPAVIIVLTLIISIASASDPYSPSQNAPLYPINTVNDPGALFPLGGDIPSARVHHTITSTSDYLLIYGGYATDGSFLGDINVFHIPSQSWSGPIQRKQCCNAEGEKIETIGADLPTGSNFDVDAELPGLHLGFQGDAPLPRAEHAVCALNEEMYLFGGLTELYSYVNDLYIYNPKSVTWKVQDSFQGASFPQRRAGHSMVCDPANNVFYIFGGRSSFGRKQDVGLNDLWRYDPTQKVWTLLTRSANKVSASTPGVRQYASMVMLNGNLYLFGGINPSTGMVYSDVWVFRMGIQQWSVLYNRKLGNTNVGATTNNAYQFAPPALFNAHLIPIPASLDPFTGFNTTTYGTELDKQSNENVGFLVYGGVGGGGMCGAVQCGATETTLGQVYKFSISEGSWTSPHTTTGAATLSHTANNLDAERQYVQSSTWEYARLSTSDRVDVDVGSWVDRGKYIKTFALEKVVFNPARNLMYEIGGMVARKMDPASTVGAVDLLIAQQQASALHDSDVLYADKVGSSVPLSNTGNYPVFLYPASGALPQPRWDKKTGEQLRERVDLPTNGFWDYSSGFDHSSGSTYESSASSENAVVFLRAFRTYTVSPSDIVLIKEDLF